MRAKKIIEYMRQELGPDVLVVSAPRDRRVFINIRAEALRKAVEALKRKYPALRFMTISTVDCGLHFEFLHHFHVDGVVITLRSVKPKEENLLESIADIVPAANFIEREIAELFGIKVMNHPKMRSLILTEDWAEDKRPLRKPLRGILPPQARRVAESLISMGCVAPISRFIERRREAAGLPKTPPFAFTDEENMKELHGIIKEVSLSEKVGFDWEKKRLRYR
ncbi:hypothetical protein CW700_04700 [Candidatus Bathyarchaeota archaeon]|nr:NADH-quinone oxidoreductase subunit C [Candidatus Bathyarchaeota archaeon]RJS89296.1 MAG: hypothetical protein CW700_04700 [Candidatus Bathyarchaeota archaeon]